MMYLSFVEPIIRYTNNQQNPNQLENSDYNIHFLVIHLYRDQCMRQTPLTLDNPIGSADVLPMVGSPLVIKLCQ